MNLMFRNGVNSDIFEEYFNWLYTIMCEERPGVRTSYRKLFYLLHDIQFKYSQLIPLDANRESDGKALRYRFSKIQGHDDISEEVFDELEYGLAYIFNGGCSVLEMIVALAIRCEETIMDDPRYGDRTRQWFWQMLKNIGLSTMTDDQFDEVHAVNKINNFIFRNYEPDGKGGLFYIRDCKTDLREIEIWQQLCWYLNTIS